MYNFNIVEKAAEIHANNVAAGWWPEDQCIAEKLQMISTEIAEATEGVRKNIMDDHLPHRKMFEVELADTLIRLLDIVGLLKLDMPDATVDADFDEVVQEVKKSMEEYTVARQLLHLTCDVAAMYDCLYSEQGSVNDMPLVADRMILHLAAINDLHGLDVIGAMEEKLAYNKTRADHKLENRTNGEAGSKAF